MGNRGSIEKWEDLPEIEFYENTNWVYKERTKNDRIWYKSDDLDIWDDTFANVTETSREMHDFYISDPINGDYQMPNQSWVIIMGEKDDENTIYFGNLLNQAACELNKMEITPLFIDLKHDPILSATYDHTQQGPSLFFISNETQMVY